MKLLKLIFGFSSLIPLISQTAWAASPELVEIKLPENVRKELEREEGQSSFLNFNQDIQDRGLEAHAFGAAAPAAPQSADRGAQREQEESDVFKVGPEGSKILFLLSHSRGLLSISFEKGLDKPEIVGRVRPKGLFPSQMYYEKSKNLLVGVETNYTNSFVTYYKVADPKNPQRGSSLKLEGSVMDSRRVGDILYLVTKAPYSWGRNSNSQSGQIYSVRLENDGLKLVDTLSLELPLGYNENMGIQEVVENNEYKYFVTAVLNKSNDWSNNQSAVQLVDISDPEGKISNVMLVNAKGFVEKRQQIAIKNGALLVTSQYTVTSSGRQRTDRYAVESFLLPTSHSKKITEETWKLNGIDKDTFLERPSKNTQQGLILEKILATSTVTLGDTTGQSTDLQDVRYVDNLAYVHWVPANLVDPFDIIDVSDVKNLKFITRLQHEGWASRSFPVKFKDKNYTIGLGWIVPPENNEEELRQPQVLLFEVKPKTKADGTTTYTSHLIQQFSLPSATSRWGSFGGDQDKFFELKLDQETGKGSLMFPINLYTQRKYISGAKLVGIDLSKVDEQNIFTEGGTIVADYGYLARIFNNPEFNKFQGFVNNYDSESLSTYDVGHSATVGGSEDAYKPLSVLELARNIVGYELLSDSSNQKTYGVQIVSSRKYADDKIISNIQFRLVNAKNPDASEIKVLQKALVDGSYSTHLSTSKGLLVATSDYRYDEQTRKSSNEKKLFLIGSDNGKLKILDQKTWVEEENNNRFGRHAGLFRSRRNWDTNQELIPLENDEVLVSTTADKVRVVKLSTAAAGQAVLEISERPIKNAAPVNAEMSEIKEIGKKLYLTVSQIENVEGTQALEDSKFVRNSFAPLNLVNGNYEIEGKLVNIPGELKSVFKLENTNHVITEDSFVSDFEPYVATSWNNNNRQPSEYVGYQVVQTPILVSLKVDASKATLVDTLNSESLNSEGLVNSGHALVSLSAGDPVTRNEDDDGFFNSFQRRDYVGHETRLNVLTFTPSLRFKPLVKAIRGNALGDASLQSLTAHPLKADSQVALITSDSKAQVLSWNTLDYTPSVIPVKVLSETGAYEDAEESVDLPVKWGVWKTRSTVYADKDKVNMALSLGTPGVFQLQLSK